MDYSSKIKKDLSMLGLNETIVQLTVANSVCWSGQLSRRRDGHVLIMAFDFVVEGQRKKGRLKMTWKKQVEEETEKRLF